MVRRTILFFSRIFSSVFFYSLIFSFCLIYIFFIWRYDWKGAQVPPPLTQEEEEEKERKQNEKKKAKRVEKKEKDKQLKEEERVKKEHEKVGAKTFISIHIDLKLLVWIQVVALSVVSLRTKYKICGSNGNYIDFSRLVWAELFLYMYLLYHQPTAYGSDIEKNRNRNNWNPKCFSWNLILTFWHWYTQLKVSVHRFRKIGGCLDGH